MPKETRAGYKWKRPQQFHLCYSTSNIGGKV